MQDQIGVHKVKPRFDGTINLGHVLSAVALMVTVGGLGVTQIRSNAQLQLQVAAIQQSVTEVKTEVAAYGPRMALVENVNGLNAERITNAANSARSLREELASNMAELRTVDNDIIQDVNRNKVAIAGIESTLYDRRPNGQRSSQ